MLLLPRLPHRPHWLQVQRARREGALGADRGAAERRVKPLWWREEEEQRALCVILSQRKQRVVMFVLFSLPCLLTLAGLGLEEAPSLWASRQTSSHPHDTVVWPHSSSRLLSSYPRSHPIAHPCLPHPSTACHTWPSQPLCFLLKSAPDVVYLLCPLGLPINPSQLRQQKSGR